MPITSDELIPKSLAKVYKVQHGKAVSSPCGDDVGFVIDSHGNLHWFGHGCSLTTGFCDYLCEILCGKPIEDMVPLAMSECPKTSFVRQGCVNVVIQALLETVNDIL